jgi:ornithine cyclodeaminase/alanine dehydrogenase-like protein (mu-crystallin family)
MVHHCSLCKSLRLMSAQLIGKHALGQILSEVGLDRFMDDMIHDLTIALKEHDPAQTEVMARNGFVYPSPNTGVLEWMPVMHANGKILVKLVAYNPTNPEQVGLPTIHSTMALFDSRSGRLCALTDGVLLTAVRTGASSAVASRVLAKPDSRIVGLVGCGAQAVTQLHALSRVFALEHALVYDVDQDSAESFAQRMAYPGLGIEVVPLQELEESSDIICTATTVAPGHGPVITGTNLKRGVHVNAVGSDLPGKTELPLHLLQNSFICPDFPEQAIKEGECQQLPAAAVKGPSFFELVQNHAQFEAFQQQTTIFDSTGFALEDLVIVTLLCRYAQELGLGTSIDIEATSDDPKNPYSFLMTKQPKVSNLVKHA